ncbi:MAG TPA: tetratricopeptide repeat protein [Nitrospirales bacterium]|nr:tetratricopeptide repeat protein [Nitrospirales bacterium]
MSRGIGIAIVIVMMVGCASAPPPPRHRVLAPPASAKPEAAKLLVEGNRLYNTREWDAAREQYELAVKAQPDLPEAHYNLGMAYYVQRKDMSARKHFVEAANLAPGDKVIWDAPVFQSPSYEIGTSEKKDTGTKVMPAIGGMH